MSPRLFLPSLAVLLVLSAKGVAQGLSSRISALRDGSATLTYAARPDVCGDGRNIILRGFEQRGEMIIFTDGGDMITSIGTARLPVCETGPVRLRFVVQDHRVGAIWPSVGHGPLRAEVDLGVVSTAEAVTWLLGVARSASEQTASRALLAAAIADSVRISTRIFAIARDRSLAPATREQALKWATRVAPRTSGSRS